MNFINCKEKKKNKKHSIKACVTRRHSALEKKIILWFIGCEIMLWFIGCETLSTLRANQTDCPGYSDKIIGTNSCVPQFFTSYFPSYPMVIRFYSQILFDLFVVETSFFISLQTLVWLVRFKFLFDWLGLSINWI